MKRPSKELQHWFKEVAKNHRKAILHDKFTKEANSPPVVYLKKGDELNMVAIKSEDESPMSALKAIVNHFVPEAYLFCAESWILQQQKDDPDNLTLEELREKYPDGIKDHPNRSERLIEVSGTIEGYRNMEMYEIVRYKNHRIKKLVKESSMQDGKGGNRLESDKIP